APSHVVLHQPGQRLLVSGDHVLGRTSLYFDHGWTPDPVAEFLKSLELVERLDVRLTLAGHGRPFTDLRGHVAANRALVHERLEAVADALRERPASPPELVFPVYGESTESDKAPWLLTKLRCYLDHLERQGRAQRVDGDPERWAPA
nr:MBL fold metallo-hydrolase [Solirubrobacterales bacterium]